MYIQNTLRSSWGNSHRWVNRPKISKSNRFRTTRQISTSQMHISAFLVNYRSKEIVDELDYMLRCDIGHVKVSIYDLVFSIHDFCQKLAGSNHVLHKGHGVSLHDGWVGVFNIHVCCWYCKWPLVHNALEVTAELNYTLFHWLIKEVLKICSWALSVNRCFKKSINPLAEE